MLVDEVLKRADVARTTLTRVNWQPCTPVWKRQNVAINAIAHSLAVSGRNAGMRILRDELEDLWLPLLNRLRVPIEQGCAMRV